MISVLRLSLGMQTGLTANKTFFFFSFVVLSKQNTNKDVHMNKQTIISQNGQSILKHKTRKVHLIILEILIKTVTTFHNQILF